MNAFAGLTRAAVLGTAQHAPALRLGNDEADALVAARDGEPAERALLRAAAVTATIRRATVEPRTFGAAEDAAPDETLPRCGPLGGADLRETLAGPRGGFFAEWLDAAIACDVRVPEELLPAVLDRGASRANVRAAVRRAIGERGRWLARAKDVWGYARAHPPVAANAFAQSGDRSVRLEDFERMRRADAAAALAALESTWASETPDDRALFLAALDVELSLADEAFLERARDDARKEVRKVANALLHRLPRSQSAQRAMALATPSLVLKRELLGRELAVTLPAAYTPDMRAEGVESKPPPGIGERQFWLQQVLALVPVGHWLETFGITLEKLFEIARKNEFAEALLPGFAGAINAYRDPDARARLFELAARDDFYVDLVLASPPAAAPAPDVEAPFIAALRTRQPRATRLLERAPARWSVALTSAALETARRGLETNDDWQAHYARATFFDLLAVNADPRTPGIEAGWPQEFASDKTRNIVESLLEVLRFRKDLYDHLKDGV